MIRAFRTPVLLALVVAGPLAGQPHPERVPDFAEGIHYRVYGPDGELRSLADVVAALDGIDALLVGEHHSDAVGHEIEEELLIGAARRYGIVGDGSSEPRPLVVSLEFFERDVQIVMDEYLADLITEEQFLDAARPWDNYGTDYRPLVQFARAHQLRVIAANAPRRYVNRVTRLGASALDDVSEEARRFLPPLPYPGPSDEYRAQFMKEMMEGMAATMSAREDPAVSVPTDRSGREAPADHGMGFALQSQALWDAAMSHAVATALDESDGALVVHYVGGFHVARHTGIPEKLEYYRPGTRSLTVNIEPAEDIDIWNEEEHGGLADFVILTQAAADIEERKNR